VGQALKPLLSPQTHLKVLWGAWLLCPLALIAIALFPIRFGTLRALIVAVWLIWWALSGAVAGRSKYFKAAWGALSLLVAALILRPHPTDSNGLRAAYLTSLKSYEGTTYVWGGETARGIDCSGLVRRGMIDAYRRQGQMRRAADLWWHDCSAKALREEYRGQTQRLFDAPSLNAIPLSRLHPGDVAVTQNGVHTLAYLGKGEWIEADPGAWKVIRVRVPSKNAWFRVPMSIVRWSDLNS